MSDPTHPSASPRVRRASGLVAVFAALLFWAPTLFTASGWILLAGPLLGGTIVLLVAVNLYRVGTGALPLLTISALVTLLAVAGAAAPLLLGVANELVFWTMVVSGALAALLSAYTVVSSWRLQSRSTSATA
ncbi:hypothetical protein OB905_09810 [Halobacteria archaeon AArc-dxtr1]|nr:hypothetical protein [Halobacteria archaeon AArc-dxtr1]